MRPIRLRDFIRVGDLYFSVLGYQNSEKAKCFLRYSPDEHGDRVKDGKKFRKLGHEEALRHEAAKKYYDGIIFRVPLSDIDEIFKPEERLRDAMDRNVGKVVEFFSSVPIYKMGVTGSRLIGLQGDESDVDFVVYGRWWFFAREKLRKGIETGKISEPDEETWEYIYKKRKVKLPYEIFLLHERRKYHRAFIGETYFDLLYVRDYDELHGFIEDFGKKLGKMSLVAEVLDDRYVFDYPAFYPIKHKEIKAVLCFTHTFVGQAFKGEKIIARGDVEIINDEKYLVVGTKREVEDEYILSLDLLEKYKYKFNLL